METYRLFAAIKLPEFIVDELTDLQKGVPDAKWSDAEKFHITLGFFGDMDEAQAEVLDQYLADIRQSPFEISLSGAGHYGRAEPHSIWIGVNESSELSELARAVRKAARASGTQMDKREFRPHITLAYLRAFPDIQAVAAWEQCHSSYQSDPFWVNGFYLQSSWRRKSGANRYETEASYPLIGR